MRRSRLVERGKENGVVWEWRWGPRAAAEIGEVAVGWFVAEFIAERTRRGSAGGGGGPGRGAGSGAGGEERSDEELRSEEHSLNSSHSS